MNNYEIADHFSLLSKLMDIHGENSFKSKSYSSAAFNIERLTSEVATMSDAELFSMRGIGESTGKKIRELQHTGKLAQLDSMLAVTPPGILGILQIKGLGPKKIAVIWKEMGLESLGELEYACNENRLVALKGFGAKTQESILQSITYFRQNQGFHLWAEIETFANAMLAQMKKLLPSHRFSLTGHMRRQSEIIDFIEVITTAPEDNVLEVFASVEGATATKITDCCTQINLTGQPDFKIYFAADNNYYHQLFETSCSADFLAAFREHCKMPDVLQSEEEIFTANGLNYVPPPMREEPVVIELAKSRNFSNLILPGDIKGIIHSHSTWSDGVNTIEQMAKVARDKGLEYLVISDHSQTAFYAGGLKPEQVAAQHQEIDALNGKLAPFKIFKSIESDILSDGRLDYTDGVLATFDLVIASVHSNLKMSQDKAMERLLTAVRNPYTAILGHPTGRLLLSRKGYPIDHKQLIDACRDNNVVIEINAHPRRLDMDWRWIQYAMEQGVLLSIDPDAHSVEGYNDVYYGVKSAQKGGLTANYNLSSHTLAQFEAFLKKYRQKAQAAVMS